MPNKQEICKKNENEKKIRNNGLAKEKNLKKKSK